MGVWLVGVFFVLSFLFLGCFTFYFEMDAEMSLPPTPAWDLCTTDPCAKPSTPPLLPRPLSWGFLSSSLPSRSAFQPLSSPRLSPSPSSLVTCFSFPSLAACPKTGEAPCNPVRFLLAFFILPKLPLSSSSQGQSMEGRRTPAARISRYMDNGDAGVPVTGAAPSPLATLSCGLGMTF